MNRHGWMSGDRKIGDDLVHGSLLVGLGRSVVLLLLRLVGDGITGGLDTAEGVRIMLSESGVK